MTEPIHIVAVSGGKDSTAMALALKEREPDRRYEFVITPTGRELPPMVEHWRKLEQSLGQPLIRIPAPSFVDYVKKHKTLPNHQLRWCTRLIKIEPFVDYVSTKSPAVACVGIRADEVGEADMFGESKGRKGTDYSAIDGVVQDFPLVRWGWGLQKVLNFLRCRDMMPPKRTDCDLCFFQRLIEWYELWRDYPDLYLEAVALEDFTGHTLRSPQRDSWPAALKDLAREFESGRIPKDTRDSRARSTMCAWCAR